MNKNIKEEGLERLRLRAQRLIQLLALGSNKTPAPKLIISQEIHLIMEAAWMYCPSEMGQTLSNERHVDVCKKYRCCIKCGNSAPYADSREYTHGGLCDKCAVDSAAEDQESPNQ